MPNEQQAQDTGTTAGQEQSSTVGTEQTTQQQEKTFTQAEVNAFLAKEKNTLKKQAKQELEAEQKQEQAKQQGEYQKLYEAEQAKVAQLTQDLADIRLDLARSKVGAKHKLTPEQAARLRGKDEAELDADAKELVKVFGIQQEQQPPAHEGTPEGSRESRSRADSSEEHYKRLQSDPLYGF